MATELTVVLRFEDEDAPSKDDLEFQLDCIVLEYELEEDV